MIIFVVFGLYACSESTVTEPKVDVKKLNGTWYLDNVNDSTFADSPICYVGCAFIFKDINSEIYFQKNDSIFYKTKFELMIEDNVEVLIIKKYPFPAIIRNEDGTFVEVFSDYKFIINFANDSTLTLQLISNSVSDNVKIDPPATFKRRKI